MSPQGVRTAAGGSTRDGDFDEYVADVLLRLHRRPEALRGSGLRARSPSPGHFKAAFEVVREET